MARKERKFDDALRARLLSHGQRFGFFQAVHLLHRLAPGAIPVGGLGPVRDEPVRFTHDPRLIFHSSDVAKISSFISAEGKPSIEVMSSFLGLFGTVSPLATTMAEDVLDANDAEQTSVAAFYDLFHHRILSLFFRAWQKYRFDCSFAGQQMDVMSRRMFAFVGVDSAGALPKRGLPPFQLLSFAPMLGNRTRPTTVLQSILSELFPEAKVRVECFVLRRADLQVEQQFFLGRQNSTLGLDTTVGRYVHDRSGRFRVHLENISYETFTSLMPDGDKSIYLRQIIEQFSLGILEPEVELAVRSEESPRFELGSKMGAQLGVTTLLGKAEVSRPLRVRMLLNDDLKSVRVQGVIEDV